MSLKYTVLVATTLTAFVLAGCNRKPSATPTDPALVPAAAPPGPAPLTTPPRPSMPEPNFDKTLSSNRTAFPKEQFSIRFPKDFEQIPASNSKAVVVVSTPAKTANINIRLSPAQPTDSLDAIVQGIRKGMATQVQNPTFGANGELSVAGRRCVWLQMSHGPPEKRVSSLTYMIKRQTDILMVFCTSSPEILEIFRAAFDDCVRSIQIP